VSADDVDELTVKHLENGETVERLTENTDAITRNLIFTVLDAGILPGSM
jgi:hypothetical protein